MAASATTFESTPTAPARLELPSDFRPELDVLVLAGDGSGVAAELARRGIQRVVTFAPSAGSARSARVATTSADVVAQLFDFDPPAQHVRLLRLPGVSDEQFATLKRDIEGARANRATFAASGRLWIRHAFANLPKLAQSASIADLKAAFAGKPCVLVSPGPSLSKNIDLLPRLSNQALIVASNRALAPLRQAGVVPHVVVVGDALDLRYQLDGGLLEGVPAVVLDLISHPSVGELPMSRCFFFSAVREVHDSIFPALGQDAFLPAGGSVATVAFSLALHLAAAPIAFVGQDLALDGAQYYVAGAPDDGTRIRLEDGVGVFENLSPELRRAMHEGGGTKLDEQARQRFLKVPGYRGGEVLTSRQFDDYRRWLGEAARQQAGKVRIVNATEGGARIEHMAQARLVDLAAEFGPLGVDAEATFQSCYARAGAYEDAVRQKLGSLLTALDATAQALRTCQQVSGEVEGAPQELGRLDAAETELNAGVRQLPFLIASVSAEVEASRRAAANATSLSECLVATRALYAAIERALSWARPELTAALTRLGPAHEV